MELQTEINYSLVAISIVVAVFASYVALNLANNFAKSTGRLRSLWLASGAFAMGMGIWSMHFIGMLAYRMPGAMVGYSLPLMFLSVLVAIFASLLAFNIVSRPLVSKRSLFVAGVAMAAAIAGMHYLGMYSMHMDAVIEWNFSLVSLSIAIALLASFAALRILTLFRDRHERVGKTLMASVVMGAAISGMHYTGMLAATFVHHEMPPSSERFLIVDDWLLPFLSAVPLMLLGMVMIGSYAHRLYTSRTQSFMQRQTQLSTIANAVPVLIAQFDKRERLLFANEAFRKWFNAESDQLVGRSFRELLGEERYPQNEPYIKKALSGEMTSYERVSKSESTLATATLDITFVPEFDGDKSVRGFIVVASDVTKFKEIQTELEKARSLAEEANAVKSAFLANMSHEIRTPLGAVLGFSDLLMAEDTTPTERDEYIEVIKRNGELLSNIINDILDLSKVEIGKLEVETTDVPFTELLNEVRSILGLEASAKGISLSVEASSRVPCTIHTDALRLRQILFNIVGNAIKFTSRGSVTVSVERFESQNLGPQLAFVVKDTGEGIKPEQVQKLFAPFSQADVSTTRRFGGTGLGLALSRKLARMLGGDLELSHSVYGEGSTFTLTIGLMPLASLGSNQPQLGDSEYGENEVDLGDIAVLVADDSLDNQALIQRILTRAGARVTAVSNGREAIDQALKGEFSIILMDIQMPVMDGYEAVGYLRRAGYSKPILALTAHAMNEEKRKTLVGGFDDHLTKPIDRERLLRSIIRFK